MSLDELFKEKTEKIRKLFKNEKILEISQTQSEANYFLILETCLPVRILIGFIDVRFDRAFLVTENFIKNEVKFQHGPSRWKVLVEDNTLFTYQNIKKSLKDSGYDIFLMTKRNT